MYLSVSTREYSPFTKIKDRFDEGYGSDGGPGPFFKMEDLEDTQDYYKGNISDFVPLYSGENSSNDKGNEYFLEGGDK